MQNINSKNEIIEVINNLFKAHTKKLLDVFQMEFVENKGNKRLTMLEVSNLLSGRTDLNTVPEPVLLWIFAVLKKYNKELKSIEYYFNDNDIQYAENFTIKRSVPINFPLRIKVLDRLDPYREVYQTNMSVKYLNSLQENGLLHLYKEIQRESTISVYNGQFISHVKYNPEKVREIGKLMANREFWSTAPVILLLVQDGQEDYNVINDELIINSGNIATLDGNHRINATSFALALNANIDLKLEVIFVVGTIPDGKTILYQSEKREPLSTEQLKTLGDTPEVYITNGLIISKDLDSVYKFCKTTAEIKVGVGFVLESILIDSIGKYYELGDLPRNHLNKIKNWLIEYFNELADILSDEFKNYRNLDADNWSASPFAFAGYVYISSKLYGKNDWSEKLKSILDHIHFENRPWTKASTKQIQSVIEICEEAISFVLK